MFKSVMEDKPYLLQLKVISNKFAMQYLDTGFAGNGNKVNTTNTLVSFYNAISSSFIEPVNLPAIN